MSGLLLVRPPACPLFARRLRGEIRFPTLGALRAQIAADVEQTRTVLWEHGYTVPQDHEGA